MKFLTILPVLLLAATVTSNPVPGDDKLELTESVYDIGALQYTAEHDIVSLLVPLNKINFDDDDDTEVEDDSDDVTLFFTEADVDDTGDKQYKGLYVLKGGKATKVLDKGRDAAALNDDTKIVYIGALDGIYTYNGDNGATVKYGTIDDGIIQIEADNQTGLIYFLTEDNHLYSAADEGATKDKVEQVADAQEFAIDYVSNIYFYNSQKELFVFNTNGVKKFENLPKLNSIKLVNPMFAMDEGVFAILDETLYGLRPNGSVESADIILKAKPTAYAPEATLLQYYAYNKKIYGFNIMQLLEDNVPEFKKFLEDNRAEIQTIATKSRSSF